MKLLMVHFHGSICTPNLHSNQGQLLPHSPIEPLVIVKIAWRNISVFDYNVSAPAAEQGRSQMNTKVSLRITLTNPPENVNWRVQSGKVPVIGPSSVSNEAIVFDIEAEVVSTDPIKWRGAIVQGPSGGKFVYINSGKRAGNMFSQWDRRAKISLMPITAEQIEEVLNDPSKLIEVSIAGKAKDGGPCCASVPLLGDGWVVTREPGNVTS